MLCSFLVRLGVKRGDRVALVSKTMIEEVLADLAAACMGAISVPIFPNVSKKELEKILVHSEPRVIFLEDGDQVKKIYEVHKKLKHAPRMVLLSRDNYVTHYGTFDDFHKKLIHFNEFFTVSKGQTPLNQDDFLRMIKDVSVDDIFSIMYSPGTSARFRGVVVTYRMAFANISQIISRFKFVKKDSIVNDLPLAGWMGRFLSVLSLSVGWRTYLINNIPAAKISHVKNIETLRFTTAPDLERGYYSTLNHVSTNHPIRKTFMLIAIGLAISLKKLLGRKGFLYVSMLLYYFVKTLFLFNVIRYFGRRLKFIIINEAQINPNVIEFYSALGIPIVSAYGLLETFSFVVANYPNKFKNDMCGVHLDGIGVKVADDGRVLLRGKGVFKEYYKDLKGTRESFNGVWFDTGDVGSLDGDILRVYGKLENKIKTSYGNEIHPMSIEMIFDFDDLLDRVFVYGDGKPFLSALVTLNRHAVLDVAKQKGIYFTDYKNLCAHNEIIRHTSKVIRGINSGLEFHERIKNFKILDRSFSVEEGELTPSGKFKRKEIVKKYYKLLEGMY